MRQVARGIVLVVLVVTGSRLDSRAQIGSPESPTYQPPISPWAAEYISTLVGNGIAGGEGDGGPGPEASVYSPWGIALDAAGNVYVADTGSYRVRLLSAATGIMTTIAGTGGFDSSGDGGPAIAAQISSPIALTLDDAGNVFVAESGRIRRIDAATRVITTISGTGILGFSGDGGPATAARINAWGMDIDGAGNLYFADGTSRVRRISATTGVITTIAGTGVPGYDVDFGLATVARLRYPTDVAVDVEGNVYIADTGNHRIRLVSATDNWISTIAGSGNPGYSGDGGLARTAGLWYPTGIAVTKGVADPVIYVADRLNNRVRRVSPGGRASARISTVAGTGICSADGDGGSPTTAGLCGPVDVVVDAGENLFISDWTNQRVRKVTTWSDDIPLAGSFDGDRIADPVVWRPANGLWAWLRSDSTYDYANALSRGWGNRLSRDIPLLAEIDGDGQSDLVVWRASTGTWYWLLSSTTYDPANGDSRQWGNVSLGDVPVVGDLDGDGRSELIVWRATTGTWHWLTSSSGYGAWSAHAIQWGNGKLGDVPLVGDFDGDGRGDLTIWRPSSGTWYWLTSSSGFDPAGARAVQWGNAGDVARLGDFDGDRRADPVVWRQSTGEWFWLTSSTGYAYENAHSRQWGHPGATDVPVLGDYDGDGRTDLAVWRAWTGIYYWLPSSTLYDYAAARSKQWGSKTRQYSSEVGPPR